MIKVLTAYTHELDHQEKAVQDILGQIDIKNGLLKNSAALLFCHSKFIEMGVMEAVCKSLPFDTVGCTSMNFALPGQIGQIMLTVTVLTSDEVEFAAGICEPLTIENAENCINALYQKTAAFLDGTSNLVFAFPPTMFDLTIDIMSAALNRACRGIPIFGTVALDVGVNIRNPKTIYRGAAYSDRMALLLFKGPVNPRFFFLRFPEKSALAQDAVITSADGPQLICINNQPAASFLRELGLFQNSKGGFAQAIPLVIQDSEGNNPEVVVVQKVTAEGTLICGRHIPVGGIINIGAITRDYVLESAKMLIQHMKELERGAGLFIISCFLRTIVLGEGAMAEVELIQQELSGYPSSWLYLNSGGELCPGIQSFTDADMNGYTKIDNIKRKRQSAGTSENQALQFAITACQL